MLTVRKFFGSDDFSLADVMLARDFALLNFCGFHVEPSMANMSDWLHRMMALPYWQEAMEAVKGIIYSQNKSN